MPLKNKRGNCSWPFASCLLFLSHPCVSRNGETIVDSCRIQSVCKEPEGVKTFPRNSMVDWATLIYFQLKGCISISLFRNNHKQASNQETEYKPH